MQAWYIVNLKNANCLQPKVNGTDLKIVPKDNLVSNNNHSQKNAAPFNEITVEVVGWVVDI